MLSIKITFVCAYYRFMVKNLKTLFSRPSRIKLWKIILNLIIRQFTSMAISHLVYKLDWLPVFNYSTSLRDVLRYYRESKHGILSLGVSRWKWNWNFFVSSITIFFDFFFLKNPVKRSFNVFTVILILNRSCFYQAFFFVFVVCYYEFRRNLF